MRDAVYALFADEKVRPEYLYPSPDLTETESGPSYRMLTLDALVRMKITSFRGSLIGSMFRDMMDVGLIDVSWLSRVPPELRSG